MASPAEVVRHLRITLDYAEFSDPTHVVYDFCTNVLGKVTATTEPRWILVRLREFDSTYVLDWHGQVQHAIDEAADLLDV